MSIIKNKYFVLSILVLILSVVIACTPEPQINKVESTVARQVSEGELSQSIITSSANFNEYRTNILGEKHKYTIYRLPYLPINSQSNILDLVINLNEPEEALKSKGFFLVETNVSDKNAVNIEEIVIPSNRDTNFNNIQPSVLNSKDNTNKTTLGYTANTEKGLNTLFESHDSTNAGIQHSHANLMGIPFEVKKPKRTFKSLLNFSGGQTQIEYYNALQEYPGTDIISSQRNFIFNSVYHQVLQEGQVCAEGKKEATLYKKVSFQYKGQTIRFALWVDDTGVSEEQKPNIKTTIDEFVRVLDPSNTDNASGDASMYAILYALNNKHVWGAHGLGGAAAPSDSVIHIGFGQIDDSGGSNSVIQGYVDPRVYFTSTQVFGGEVCDEEIKAPTIYMNKNLLKNGTSYLLSNSLKARLFIIIMHEMQHLFVNYVKMVLGSQGSVDLVKHNIVESWLHELLAVSTEYLAGYHVSELVTNKNIAEAQNAYQTLYTRANNQFQTSLLLSELVNPDSEKFTVGSYNVAFLFVSYLVQNFGIDSIKKLAQSNFKNRYALYDAIKKTSKYQTLKNPPRNSEELLRDFFTSLFISDSVHTPSTEHHYKMLVKNDDTNAFNFIGGERNNIVLASFGNKEYLPGMNLLVPSINVLASPQTTSICSLDISLSSACRLNFISINNAVNLNHTWTESRGPYIFGSNTRHESIPGTRIVLDRIGGQHSVIYLGGKIRQNEPSLGNTYGKGVNLGFTIKNNKLSLQIRQIRGSLATLVKVEFLE